MCIVLVTGSRHTGVLVDRLLVSARATEQRHCLDLPSPQVKQRPTGLVPHEVKEKEE
jgi:hypothetical protein